MSLEKEAQQEKRLTNAVFNLLEDGQIELETGLSALTRVIAATIATQPAELRPAMLQSVKDGLDKVVHSPLVEGLVDAWHADGQSGQGRRS